MSEFSFTVIGISDAQKYSPSEEVADIVCQAQYFSGGDRHRLAVSHLIKDDSREWIPVTIPLEKTFEKYREVSDHIVIFASGDPLFFGIANTLQRVFPGTPIRVIPFFNSIQQACQKLCMRYDDLTYVSLTGRPWDGFDEALINRKEKIGVLTDRKHTPTAIAQRMLDYGYIHYNIYVAERLGNSECERIERLSLSDAASKTFVMPNCVILEANAPLPPKPFGIPDEDFELLDGRAKMITKAPVRLLTLRALNLTSGGTLWDIGFCTGSVSIEARLQFPKVKVVAFEKRPEGQRLMVINSRRFGTPGITCLIGDFLSVDLCRLPAPDAVFIGGHGGYLKEIMNASYCYLLPHGRIVMNSVTQESRNEFVSTAESLGMALASEQTVAIDSFNPITILTAIK